MKYLKKFENNINDILQKYHVKFMDFDNNIEYLESQIQKLRSHINTQKIQLEEVAKKCIDEICLSYGFKYQHYDAGYDYDNDDGYTISVNFIDQRAYITLINNNLNELGQEVWNIHSNNTYKLRDIFEHLEKVMLEDKSKKFNL